MIDIINLVNPGYQKAVDAAGTKETKETKDSAETTETTQETGTQTPNVDTFESSKKDEEVKTETAGDETGKIYKPNQKLVAQLKAEQAQIQAKFIQSIKDMLGKQGVKIAWADGEDNDDFWKTIAGGEYTVDDETRAAAQEAISENGYWGVKQTSQRIVDFGKALVGGNPEKIGLLKDAFIKGFNAATKSWGSALPDITNDTYKAVMDLFDQWEKEGSEETQAPAQSGGTTFTSTSVNVSVSVSATFESITITDD